MTRRLTLKFLNSIKWICVLDSFADKRSETSSLFRSTWSIFSNSSCTITQERQFPVSVTYISQEHLSSGVGMSASHWWQWLALIPTPISHTSFFLPFIRVQQIGPPGRPECDGSTFFQIPRKSERRLDNVLEASLKGNIGENWKT